MKLIRRIASLGYGSRRDVKQMLQRGRIRDAHGRPCNIGNNDDSGPYFIDGEPLDPNPPYTVLLHKPAGQETTRVGSGATVYDGLPSRFRDRTPTFSPVGRLDKDTSGLLLFTDDGALLHRLTHPRHHVPKTYAVKTARPIPSATIQQFAAGTLVLRGDDAPLQPAELRLLDSHTAELTLHEGRYHQVRRMFAAVGNHVERLHRIQVGPLQLDDLACGAWRPLTEAELRNLYAAVGLQAPE